MQVPEPLLDGALALANRLLSKPLDSLQMRQSGEALCGILDAQYYSFYFFTPWDPVGRYFVTNNPADYLPLYLSVARDDFLIRAVAESGRPYLMSEDRQSLTSTDNTRFIRAVQSRRPVSDVIYIPITYNSFLRGYWSICRAGEKSPAFSKAQFKVAAWVGAALNAAFERSCLPGAQGQDIALLDGQGHILQAGHRIASAFSELFGGHGERAPNILQRSLHSLFIAKYKFFLGHPSLPRSARVLLGLPGRDRLNFAFSLLEGRGLAFDGDPYAQVQLLQSPLPTHGGLAELLEPVLARVAGYSPREQEIIALMFQGKGNREISIRLGITESTVKRHCHNIYQKSGCRSRVEFVLGHRFG